MALPPSMPVIPHTCTWMTGTAMAWCVNRRGAQAGEVAPIHHGSYRGPRETVLRTLSGWPQSGRQCGKALSVSRLGTRGAHPGIDRGATACVAANAGCSFIVKPRE